MKPELKSRDAALLALAKKSARKKKGRATPEADLQRAIISWWDVAYKGLGVADERLLSFSNMHGMAGKMGAMRGAILKGMGARKDVPDLFLAMRSQDHERFFFGLYIELKASGKRPNKDQLVFHDTLRKQGYMVMVIDNLEDAMNLLTNYVKGTL